MVGEVRDPVPSLMIEYTQVVLCRLWDMSARLPVASVTTPHAVRSLAFSPSGGLLAAGMRDGSFSVHDTRCGLRMLRKEVVGKG